MILSFACEDTGRLFSGKRVARFEGFRAVAERKLEMLHRAVSLEDLKAPPRNRLEKLKDARRGQWSIRINDQWRVCFRFDKGNAYYVEIVDYH
ncbi:MAG: type II toxin-antitoxin system RelE/ParE family toxin [Nitrospirae bacterium]|nr:MAG: type II toxin-antitoxin system RelE/ParE family toxin [Nitrospirota bacterium]